MQKPNSSTRMEQQKILRTQLQKNKEIKRNIKIALASKAKVPPRIVKSDFVFHAYKVSPATTPAVIKAAVATIVGSQTEAVKATK